MIEKKTAIEAIGYEGTGLLTVLMLKNGITEFSFTDKLCDELHVDDMYEALELIYDHDKDNVTVRFRSDG